MRAVVLDGDFGLRRLSLVERERPSPGPGEVLLRVQAVSLNPRDLLMVEGAYYPKLDLPLVVGSDAAARVVEQGAGVASPRVGARVCPLLAPYWYDGDPPRDVFATTLGGPRDGTLSEYMVVEANSLVELPDGLSDLEAACLPCAGLTAFSALCTLGNVRAGQHVLCLGTGSVSLFALQFAKALGASVTITSKSDEKLARARALGADHTLNYATTPNWGKQLRDRCIDHVVEVGGAGTFEQSLAAVRSGGTLSLIGVLSGHTAPLKLLPIFMRQLRIQGVFVGHRRSFAEMLNFIERHGIVPVVGPCFELSDFRRAFRSLEAQDHFGKICVTLS